MVGAGPIGLLGALIAVQHGVEVHVLDRVDSGPKPALLADELALRDDAEARGWNSEVARHARVIASLERHLNRLKNTTTSTTRA